ncbi:MAG: GLPGLI family protein, partial [Saprospiraceae bacterium]
MKNIITTIFMVFLTIASFAQMEGEVIYVTTINIHKQLDERGGRRAENMKKMLPKTQQIKQVLYFNETESLFKKFVEEKDVDEADIEENRNVNFMMRMMGGGDEDESYTNHDEGTILQKRDFLGKTFLITGEQEERKWKLTGETKKINGYQCMKAELQIEQPQKKEKKEKKGKEEKKGEEAKKDDRGSRGRGFRKPKNIVAWFTTQIPVSVGPKGFDQLPGLVIQVEIGGQDNLITAETINLKSLEKGTIKKPKGGKEVTQEEY